MATYKAVMRPALEYASSTWLPLSSSTSINKLQVMQILVFRTATGCTRDTNIQHMYDETLILPIPHTRAPTAARVTTIETENTTIITSLTQSYNICMTKHSYFPYTSTYSCTCHNNRNRKHNNHHIPYTIIQHTSTLHG